MDGFSRPPGRLGTLTNRLYERLIETTWPFATLVILCLLLWTPGFFSIPPMDRDESRFAQASKQMLETGDLVSIRNGATARNQKPIGIYWLQLPAVVMARATGLAKENPVWPYRVPSLLGGIGGVCACFGFGQRLVGRRAAMLGAMMLAISPVLAVETHTAKTDAALLALTTLAMGLLARAYLSPGDMQRRHWVIFWLVMGGGILVKGPITPLVVGLTTVTLVIADAIADRSRPTWLASLQPTRGLVILLIVVLPWFAAIAWRTGGAFFSQSVGGDLGGKLAGGDDAHGAPPGTHLLLLSLNLFPSGWVLLAALPAAWRARRLPAIRFLLAWLLPTWLVFEAVVTKLPHYPLPLFPALCLLGGAWALEPQPVPRWLLRAAVALSIAAAGVFGLVSLVLPFVVGAAPDHRLLGVPAFLAACLAAAMILRRRLAPGMFAAPLLIWMFLGVELPALSPLWIAPRVEAVLQARWPGGVAFAATGFAEPSLMFLCGTRTEFLSAENGARFLAGPGARALLVEAAEEAAFTAATSRLGLAPEAIAKIDGYNYSRGRRVRLRVFANPDR